MVDALQSQLLMKVLNGTLLAADTVIPATIRRDPPKVVEGPILQPEMGVLIGLAREIRGRLILESSQAVYSGLSQLMYGMALEGEMLESFVGELGNMIAGHMATHVAEDGTDIDISPPTVLVGQTKLTGFRTALLIPLWIDGLGSLQVIVVIDNQK